MTTTNDIVTYRQQIDNPNYVHVMQSDILIQQANLEICANIRTGRSHVTGRILTLMNNASIAKAMEAYEAHQKSIKEQP